ncbi:MAG: glycoside hydrolase family 125 protein [Actinomycetales bacterium]|nr:glycoside hydrolase family 125 protein [Actinomycetales bacterium]
MKAKAAFELPLGIRDYLDKAPDLSRSIATKALVNLFQHACIDRPDGSVFVQTGDIPAMWIRDSSWQVWPLIRFADDPFILTLIEGVIKAQVQFLTIDPYANAFNIEPNGRCWHKDFEDQSLWVFERKWELDSVTGFLQLSLDLADKIESSSHLDTQWWSLADALVDVLAAETEHDPKSYNFWREGAPDHDHLSNGGRGAEFANCGLIWSAFRPSDDACVLPFNIPANLHAVEVLKRLAERANGLRPSLASRSLALASKIERGIEQFAIVRLEQHDILAYEVDGLGNHVLMDDANYPSLLSIPMFTAQNPGAYSATRQFALSSSNPWFFSGTKLSGIGSPHTGQGRVWPLAVAVQGITAETASEAIECETAIAQSVTADLHIHESVDKDNAENFTREWFNWAEMTFVELVFRNVERWF